MTSGHAMGPLRGPMAHSIPAAASAHLRPAARNRPAQVSARTNFGIASPNLFGTEDYPRSIGCEAAANHSLIRDQRPRGRSIVDDVNCLQTGSWADGQNHQPEHPPAARQSWPCPGATTKRIQPFPPCRGSCPPMQSAARAQLGAALSGEVIQVTQPAMLAMEFCGPFHLLMAFDRGERHEEQRYISRHVGLPRLALRDVSQGLMFVPAGSSFGSGRNPAHHAAADMPLSRPSLGH